MSFYVGLVIFGIAVGMLSGMLGIGGGIVIVPGLVFLFGFSQSEAQGTSLALLALPVLAFAAFVYYKNGFIQPSNVGVLATGFVVGAYLGAQMLPSIPVSVLRPLFGCILLYVGFLFVLDSRPKPTQAALPAGLAAIVSALLLRFFRKPPPSDSDASGAGSSSEYHI